eukprot:NODE_97_length_21155_cov_0.234850.p2 type:complete len:579 gc:universal NODE_97_length_21155_cov_0.234850:16149-17885(+)
MNFNLPSLDLPHSKVPSPCLTESFLISKVSVSLFITRFRMNNEAPKPSDWNCVFYNLKYRDLFQCQLLGPELRSLEEYCTSTNLTTFKFLVMFLMLTKRCNKGTIMYLCYKALHTDDRLDRFMKTMIEEKRLDIMLPIFRIEAAKKSFPKLELDPMQQIIRKPELDNDLLGITVGVADNGQRLFQFEQVPDNGNVSQISFESARNQSQFLLEPQSPTTPKRKNSRSISRFTSPVKNQNDDFAASDLLSLDDATTPKSPKSQRKGLGASPILSLHSSTTLSKAVVKSVDPPQSPHQEILQELQHSPHRQSVFAAVSQVSYRSVEHRPSTPRHSVTAEKTYLSESGPSSDGEPDSPLKSKRTDKVDLHVSSSALSEIPQKRTKLGRVRPSKRSKQQPESSEVNLVLSALTSAPNGSEMGEAEQSDSDSGNAPEAENRDKLGHTPARRSARIHSQSDIPSAISTTSQQSKTPSKAGRRKRSARSTKKSKTDADDTEIASGDTLSNLREMTKQALAEELEEELAPPPSMGTRSRSRSTSRPRTPVNVGKSRKRTKPLETPSRVTRSQSKADLGSQKKRIPSK